jgi:hypothetical protein
MSQGPVRDGIRRCRGLCVKSGHLLPCAVATERGRAPVVPLHACVVPAKPGVAWAWIRSLSWPLLLPVLFFFSPSLLSLYSRRRPNPSYTTPPPRRCSRPPRANRAAQGAPPHRRRSSGLWNRSRAPSIARNRRFPRALAAVAGDEFVASEPSSSSPTSRRATW